MSVSNFLKEGRAEISLQLGTIGEGLIYTHIPQRPNPPCFIVSPGSPYVEEGETFTEFRCRFDVLILAGHAQNEGETENLDDLIIKSLDALETWDIEGVEQPSQFEINGSYFLGTKITISQDKNL